jgi:hypothetical protein
MDEVPAESLDQSIGVSEYVIVQETWQKVIKYVVKSHDSSGETTVLRSSKDFKELRKVLLTRWPGCSIPVILEAYSKVSFI